MGKQYLNGVLYGTGEIIKFSPEIYSLEEREVGVWTDGKPLYQKTWVFENYELSNGSNPLSLGITTFDTICESNIHVTNSAHTNIRKVNYYEEGTFDSLWYVITYSTGIIYLYAQSSWPSPNIYVTIQYTKTTDTPGSGHYTTKGDIAHHYSTTEQIVGTWIDGKPLYEKTIVGNDLGNSSTTTTLFTATVEKIQKYDVILRHANGNAVNANMLFNGGSLYTVDVNGSGNLNLVRSSASAWQDWYTIVTVQYTKTTD